MEPLISDEKKTAQVNTIAEYFRLQSGTHGLYVFRYFVCEVLNFVNVIGQMFFLDMFLGYEFSTYGLDVVNFSEMEPEDREDPMHTVFPKASHSSFVLIFQMIVVSRLERRFNKKRVANDQLSPHSVQQAV